MSRSVRHLQCPLIALCAQAERLRERRRAAAAEHEKTFTLNLPGGAPTERRASGQAQSKECDDEPSLCAVPGGWNWRAPLGGSRAAWVKLRVHHADGVAPRAAEARAPSVGIDLRWRSVPDCAGPGYFLLGDAAATLDPSSSHGVLRAPMSGIFAGHLLAATHDRSLDRNAAAALYCDWIRGKFSHDTAALRALWQRHPSVATRRTLLMSLPGGLLLGSWRVSLLAPAS